MLTEGLYEQVISKALDKKLNESSEIKYDAAQIDNEEAPAILSKYISEIVRKALFQVQTDDIATQVIICKGGILPPNTYYDCGSFVVNRKAVVGKELAYVLLKIQHRKELLPILVI